VPFPRSSRSRFAWAGSVPFVLMADETPSTPPPTHPWHHMSTIHICCLGARPAPAPFAYLWCPEHVNMPGGAGSGTNMKMIFLPVIGDRRINRLLRFVRVLAADAGNVPAAHRSQTISPIINPRGHSIGQALDAQVSRSDAPGRTADLPPAGTHAGHDAGRRDETDLWMQLL